MSHSDSRADHGRRRAAAPGGAATTASQGPRRPVRQPRDPDDHPGSRSGGPVLSAITRAGELTACCAVSAVISLLVLGAIGALVIAVYTLTK
ncbi:hypothetical protein [Actinacidiphila acididurans]|uniref:Uncharacterized protein n=1 Tax=Actinacidiphila acididurans TaxID=2784346 RepID=A0ABS2U252_9ACTN|nr:hypothetical protein [Actinacidiphila acididurans]MBM9509661.1 hypothetical protein [Actinacidiphila acididurans]